MKILNIKQYIVAIIAFCILSSGQIGAQPALIPYPNSLKTSKGYLTLSKSVGIKVEDMKLLFAKNTLQAMLTDLCHLEVHEAKHADIRLELATPWDASAEAYRLTIDKHGILIEGGAPQGVYYGLMTLRQLLLSAETQMQGIKLPCLQIEDAPKYRFRALMLDPARHFLPVDAVKQYIDRMSHYKLNTLQLHLTDDQGWRLAVDKHPRLTNVGAKRSGDNRIEENGFYSATDLLELVAYAEQRGIEIISEIDVPGHTAALLTAYPELRGDMHPDSTFVLGRTDNVMLSATTPKVYEVLDDVLANLATIFPRGSRLHLGGDESAIKRNWARSTEHRQLMRQLDYHSAEQLMGYFFERVLASARKHGFRPMLWCELDEIRMPAGRFLFDYPQDVALVSWRMGLTPKCIELTQQSGHELILAPGESAYFDYPQYRGDLPEHNNWGMPITTLKQAYTWDLGSGVTAKAHTHISGVMGTLWGEAIKNMDRAYYMTYPRALALAEIGWTELPHRQWTRFAKALPTVLDDLLRSGVPYRAPFEVYRSEGRHLKKAIQREP
ncbi:MAG: beta-N-acetylhexosaminidase [Porphyromonadaceae bacterium]|nr:beta-N-acetylhexosaminidase [Porphyromonadaceae bacterium]